ncbi:bifunctional 4-hydroxy-2-oxoglutarate aldolase/2-dehydro-3-deoxy-phosphogluconate aldolase [Mycetocola sp. 2940]|uniref:bifunctional 4-hydroxy-2-oxoglutarate aldolase/2-dehydro-3-deoxy-phosphogluconate aldolase n=1 Tax=Mycetocola sp. 2940 TaxID=3156452 RepID=UPI0033918F14
MSDEREHPLFSHRVVPLASISDPGVVDAIGDGLVSGGLPVVEVALRSDFGLPALRRLADRGDILVGAGTVLSIDQARDAIDAGAAFIVTPGLDLEVVKYVRGANLPIVPGVLTPTEIQSARAAGLTRVKLFPAGVFGGVALIEAYSAVFRDVKFMPSGGVGPANLAAHLAHPAVFAVSGSWIVQPAAQGASAVAERAREAVGASS